MIKPAIHSLNILVLLLVGVSEFAAADSYQPKSLTDFESNDGHKNEPYSKLEKKYNGIRGQQSSSGNDLRVRELRKNPPVASKADKKLKTETKLDSYDRSRTLAVPEQTGYYRQFDRPIRVACAGDSLTRGKSSPGQEYPTFLEQYLGSSFETGNFGSRRSHAIRGLPGSYENSGMYQFSLDFEADIYLLMLGTNDINFWEDYAHLYKTSLQWHVQKARESSPGVRVMLALPPWIKRGNDVVKNSVMFNNVIPEVRKAAQAEGIQLVDIYGATKGRSSAYLSDGVHFNPEGNRIIAEAWKEAIECNPNGLCEVGESCITCPHDCFVNCPSPVPSASPSESLIPSQSPSSSPTVSPSESTSPSNSPSSSPTALSERTGYYQQFDRPIRVACAGDSLTRGKSSPGQEYPTFLEQYLGSSFETGNFGSRRSHAIRGLPGSYENSGMYQFSLDFEADIYLLMLGTNDINFWENYAHLYKTSLQWHVQKARESSPGVRVMLALPPWIKRGNDVVKNSVMFNNVIPEVRKAAQAEGLQLVDIYGATKGRSSAYLSDGVHFNPEGNRIIAEAFKEAIECNPNGLCEVGESCVSCPQDCFVNCPSPVPSASPSESLIPSQSPSSSPTGVSEQTGYYRQFGRPIRVACAGDSLTRGKGSPGEEYPTFLEQYLGSSFETGNFGSRRATAIGGLQNSYSNSGMYRFSLDFEADIYLLMLGTNDINFWEDKAHLYKTSLQWHVRRARESSPGVRVMLALPPWIKRGNGVVTNSVMFNNVIPEVRKAAQAEGLQVVDIYGATQGQSSAYVSDGVHFNPEGNRIIAEAFKEAIECNPNGLCEVGESCITCPQDCFVNCPSSY